MSKFIITGGPGSGKTKLLEALKSLNYNCSEEASRQLIVQEVKLRSNCLPWIDLSCFADKVLDKMVSSYRATVKSELTFYDRGIPDIIAYLKVAGLPVPDNYYHISQQHPYHKTVFILPPWQEIYVNDTERWQTYPESEQLYWGIAETYESLSYTLVEVPKLSVKERVNFIIDHINTAHVK
ncbi:AAA family ATPase [Mucilaginibacter aquaedulcis]|uniref:AAA family ATPase n=1 Tax=Mucilaginibacter aquaedulcis TaxID=1187081 RepID=UPI0025B35F61|nr:AAA family ATPase [Mucilaginibacter aquaedulcis]MDN3548219.1 AAA family ATPase [Mucilaginibacter aquaedulcis]